MKEGSKGHRLSWISNLFVYPLLIIAIASAYFLSAGNQPRILFGYSIFTVISGSMRPEIPINSLVVVKVSDPGTIEVGDDIVYIREDRTIITHRVINVTEDYLQSGMRGFQTKGLSNPEPDREIVYADNVVGVLIYKNAELGSILTYLKSRVWLVVLLFAGATILVALLKHLYKTGKPETADAGKIVQESGNGSQEPVSDSQRPESDSQHPESNSLEPASNDQILEANEYKSH